MDKESNGSDGDGVSIFTFDEGPYEGGLSHIKQELERQRSFIVSGLKSIGRLDEQHTGCGVLAETLDWRTSVKPQKDPGL